MSGEERSVNLQSLDNNNPHFPALCGSLPPINCISDARMLQMISPILDRLRSLSPSDHTEILGNARLREIIGNFPSHMGPSDFLDNQKDCRFDL